MRAGGCLGSLAGWSAVSAATLGADAQLRASMRSSNGLICWSLGLVLATLAFPTPANAEPVDQAGAKNMAHGWLAAGRNRLSAKFSDKVRSVRTYGDFHVVELEPEGFIVTSTDDNMEPVIAFSAKGAFDTSPDNPLWILLNQDMPQRKAGVRAVRERQKAHIRAGNQQADASDAQALRESDRSKAKWDQFRNHQTKATPTPVASNSGPSYANPPGDITDSNSPPVRTAIRIKSFKLQGGQVEITHDSPSSVSILASYDAGNSWQTLDSGVFQSTWVSSRVAREAACLFKVEEDGVFDEMTVEMMRNPPPYLPDATDMLGDAGATNTGTAPLSGTYLVSVSDIRIPPLVQSQWNQSSAQGRNCYNLYTPNNYVCGCVATALAQMLRYWQYPVTGIGQVTKTIYVNGSATSGTTRGGNGSGGPYNWSLMPLVPSTATYSDAAWQMIGSLCYDAGVSVNMQYSSGGSGAYEYALAGALTGVFGYSNAKYVYPPNLLNAINSNLEAGYPVMLGIDANGSYGHSILCDGFGYSSGTMYHHLNMGWAGSCDWWYTLPAIGGPYPWNNVHCIIFNIFPTGTGELISGRVTTTQGVAVQGATVTASASGQNYTGTSDSKGYYGVKVPAGRAYSVTASKTGMSSASRSGVTVGTSTSPSYPANCGNTNDVDFALNMFSFSAVALTNSVWLRWTCPTNCGMPNNRVSIRWRTDRFPTNSSDGFEVYSGVDQVFEHSGRDCSGFVTNYYTIWGNSNSDYTSLSGVSSISGTPDMGNARILWTSADGDVYTWNLKLNGLRKSGGYASSTKLTPVGYWTASGFNDIDSDGISDILWTGKGGEVGCWLLNPDGTVKAGRSVAANLTQTNNYWRVGAFSDIDLDGTSDILWIGGRGEVGIWFLNSSGTLRSTRTVSGNLSATNYYWKVGGLNDVDRDGIPDILWTGNGGEVGVWLLNRDGTIKSVRSVAANLAPNGYWTASGFNDVDHDGTADILWTGAGGEVGIWFLKSDGTLRATRSVASNLLPANYYWKARGFRDIDRDGTADILWHGASGEVGCYLLNTDGSLRCGRSIAGNVTPAASWIVGGVGTSVR